jgi:hypothetical protein
MDAKEHSFVCQINNDFEMAENLMLNGSLDEAFRLSEKIGETIESLKSTTVSYIQIELFKKKFALFRRKLNILMVNVLKSDTDRNGQNEDFKVNNKPKELPFGSEIK